MTTSIVVATYNGEKYLREQMDSLRGQTLTPDEVLFFDDCSADGTVGLIEDYISRYNLKNWKVNVNPANKGYRLNFLEGAEQATGDIIFYCDQDDIWKDDKVEKIVRCFENPDVMVCAHESSRFNSHGTDEYKLVNKQGGGGLKKYDFIRAFKRPQNNGHTMAFRRIYRDKIFSTILSSDYMHFDEGLASLAALDNVYYILDESLVMHRIHTSNSSTNYWTQKSRVKDIDRQISSREVKLRRLKEYLETVGERIDKKTFGTIIDFISFTEKRVGYLRNRQLWRCVFQTFHFNRLNDWKYLAVDILCIIYNKKDRKEKNVNGKS